jgi:tetratricopeptide (TPR) repeat protein
LNAKQYFAGAAALAALVFIAFAPALAGGFVWDDDFWVHKNPHITGGKNIWEVWYSPSFPGQNYPLTYTFFRGQFLLWGYVPFGYHFANLLLHSLDAVLVWTILRRLKVRGAWIAAAVFAVHPLMTESVAWVTELKNTLSALFLLSSCVVFLDWEEKGKRGRLRLSWALYFLALSAKTYISVFPFVLFILVWLRRNTISRKAVFAILPFMLLSLLAGAFTWYFEIWHVGVRGEEWEMAAAGRFVIAGRVFWFYLGKLVLPVDFTFIYPRWAIDPSSARQWAYPALAALFGAVLWFLRRVAGRGLPAAFACYLVLVSPSLGFVSFYAQVYSFVADHYAYLAVIGPIALAADAFSRLVSRSVRRLVAAAVLAGLACLSFRQSGAYRDLETLWRDTLRKNPAAEMAHNNLGVLLLDRGEIDEAIARCRESVRLNPRNGLAWNNLGLALVGRGETAEAIKAYDRAIELRPNQAEFYGGKAYALEHAGKREEAREYYDRALRLQPNLAEALLRRGALRGETGDRAGAEEDVRSALAADPSSAQAHNQLGLLLARKGEATEAEKHYREAVRLNPSLREAQANLVNVLAESGRVAEAVSFYRDFARDDPGNPRVRYNLAVALAKTGQAEEAIAEYRRTIGLDPAYAAARANLAGLLKERGETAEAVKELEILLSRDPAHVRGRYILATIQGERGEREEARRNLERVLADDPGFAPARELLERLAGE